MTGWRKRQVMELAREVGLRDWTCNGKYGCLGAFAELVRADERELCAKVADRYVMCDPIAEAIRNRGDKHD
jgi:hypothetical protein